MSAQHAWLRRRVTFGRLPGASGGAAGGSDEQPIGDVVANLVNPDLVDGASAGPVNPHAGIEPFDAVAMRINAYIRQGIATWANHMLDTDRQLEEWMTFFWHDHFAVSIGIVRPPHLMYDHVHLLRTHALGSLPALLRDVTLDPAMLIFLNGRESSGANPNENYGRELMELFTLGVGNFTEEDVVAASIALTGWRVPFRLGSEATFLAYLHDDSPQTLVGVQGVNDVDTVIDAITSHPACAPFVAEKLARAILGDVSPGTVEDLADVFRRNDLEIRPLVAAILDAGLSGEGSPMISAPIPWYTQARHVLGDLPLPLDDSLRYALLAMGQVPMSPPNVGGFPDPSSYVSSSAISGRFTLALVMAQQCERSHPCRTAAADRRWDDLAALLLRPDGFSPATINGLNAAAATDATAAEEGAAALGLALASPELMMA